MTLIVQVEGLSYFSCFSVSVDVDEKEICVWELGREIGHLIDPRRQ